MLFPTFGSLLSLTILDFGLFRVHAGRTIGIPGYLLETASGRRILVDTGFPEKYAVNPRQAALEDGLDVFGEVITLTRDNLPDSQLRRCGLAAGDINVVVFTHTDIDHVGGLLRFAHLPLIIGYDDRHQPRPRYFNEAPFDWPAADYLLIEGDIDLCEGVRLLATPGHAPGHLSLQLALPQTGAVLLTGDAISRPAEIEEGFDGAWDPSQAIKSAHKLQAIARDHDAFVIYGHDPHQWPILKKAPEKYY